MAYLIEREGVTYCVEDNGAEWEYTPPAPVSEPTTTEPTTEDINLAILLDLYAKLEEKGVI